MSVSASSAADFSRTRTTSRATFPAPTTAASVLVSSSCSIGDRTAGSGRSGCTSGWPQYQATNSGAAMLPARSSPGICSRLALPAP